MWNPYITRSNKRRRMTALKATAAVVSCRSDMWSWSSKNYSNRMNIICMYLVLSIKTMVHIFDLR